MGSDFVQLDFFNVCLAVAIIVMCLIAFVTGNITFFGVSFILGDVLVLFNLIKCIMKKSAAGVVAFGGILFVLSCAIFYIYKYLA